MSFDDKTDREMEKILGKFTNKMMKNANIALENPLISDDAKVKIRNRIQKQVDKRIVCPYGKKKNGLLILSLLLLAISGLGLTMIIKGCLDGGYDMTDLSSTITLILWLMFTICPLFGAGTSLYIYKKQCNKSTWNKL